MATICSENTPGHGLCSQKKIQPIHRENEYLRHCDKTSSKEDSFISTTSEAKCAVSWTPGCWTFGSDSEEEEKNEGELAVETYNKAMESLSAVTHEEKPSELTFQLQNDWDIVSQNEKDLCIEKATEASKLICKIIAPNDSEKLFQSMTHHERSLQSISQSLVPLMTAYAQAPTKNLKTQILSIYAYEHTIAVLQKVHEPYAKISQRQIKKARAHARINGPGVNVTMSLAIAFV